MLGRRSLAKMSAKFVFFLAALLIDNSHHMLLVNMTLVPLVNPLYLTLKYGHLLVVISYVSRHIKDTHEICET